MREGARDRLADADLFADERASHDGEVLMQLLAPCLPLRTTDGERSWREASALARMLATAFYLTPEVLDGMPAKQVARTAGIPWDVFAANIDEVARIVSRHSRRAPAAGSPFEIVKSAGPPQGHPPSEVPREAGPSPCEASRFRG